MDKWLTHVNSVMPVKSLAPKEAWLCRFRYNASKNDKVRIKALDYLSKMIHPVTNRNSRYRLRSSNTTTLLVPVTRRSTFGDSSFLAAAVTEWNSLPTRLKSAPSLSLCRRVSKTSLSLPNDIHLNH